MKVSRTAKENGCVSHSTASPNLTAPQYGERDATCDILPSPLTAHPLCRFYSTHSKSRPRKTAPNCTYVEAPIYYCSMSTSQPFQPSLLTADSCSIPEHFGTHAEYPRRYGTAPNCVSIKTPTSRHRTPPFLPSARTTSLPTPSKSPRIHTSLTMPKQELLEEFNSSDKTPTVPSPHFDRYETPPPYDMSTVRPITFHLPEHSMPYETAQNHTPAVGFAPCHSTTHSSTTALVLSPTSLPNTDASLRTDFQHPSTAILPSVRHEYTHQTDAASPENANEINNDDFGEDQTQVLYDMG